MHNNICKTCNSEFLSKRKGIKYCSKKCASKFFEQNNRDYRKQYGKEYRKNNKRKLKIKCKNQVKNGTSPLNGIKQRCNNIKHVKYEFYGGKGIKCLLTKKEFLEIYFRTNICEKCGVGLNDENRNSKNGRTIDRIDSNGNYEENNLMIVCRSCNCAKTKMAKLKEKDIIRIRKIYKRVKNKWGLVTKLAKKFKVHRGTIYSIINNKSYKHIKTSKDKNHERKSDG